MIVCDGVDNSGKTLLVQAIAKQFPDLFVMKSLGAQTNYDFLMKQLTSPQQVLETQLWDRFLIGPILYPQFRDTGVRELTQHQIEVLWSMTVTADPLFIHCHLIEDRALFENRDQLYDWETNLRIARVFEDYFESTVKKRVRAIDYQWGSGLEGEGAIDKVLREVNWYLLVNEERIMLRSLCPQGRGQLRQPLLMLVGQQFARDNRWKVPFERSKSGRMLHDALRKVGVGMERVWFTNAFKEPGGFTTRNVKEMADEVRLIEPEIVVAIGSKAAGLLGTLGVGHVRVKHPGYYLRKYGSASASLFGDEFADVVGDAIRRRSES